MAKKSKKKPAERAAAKKAPPKAIGKSPAKRIAKPTPVATQHRIAVASVAVHVRYGRDRVEEFELRGTATLNVASPENIARTTGVVRLIGTGSTALSYNPASLNRNLIVTLLVDADDLALLREVFVTGTGSELSDPALTVWATTAAELAPDAAAEADVIEYGYSLDFDPGPGLGPR